MAVSRLMYFTIPWLTKRMVKYTCHWSCLPAARCAMLTWSGKRTQVFIRKLPSQSCKPPDLITQSTSTSRMTVVRSHPVSLQRVASCQPRLALETLIHSWWIPAIHYQTATNRGYLKTLLLQSSDRPNRQRTQRLPWSSAWMLHVLTMVFFFTVWPLKWCLRKLTSEAVTETSW